MFKSSGWITKKDLDNLYTDVRFCVADLKPGFHVITDLSECKFGSLDSIATFRKIMNFIMEKKAGQVIRITRKSSLIHKQILNLTSRYQGYKAIYVNSLEEAEKLIQESDGRHDLNFRLLQTPAYFSAGDIKGTGYIKEISTNHCQIVFFTASLAVNEQILIRLEFTLRDGLQHAFEIQAKIMEVEQEYFTAEFTCLDDDRKDLLRKCIIYEAQKEL